MNKHFTITIDRDVMAEYKKYYFSQEENCRKKKFYFMNSWKHKKKNPKLLYCPISLNEILPINPPMYSSLKKQWGDFGVWLSNHYGQSKMKYTNAVVEIRVFTETKIRRDVDNLSAKILNDGLFSESKMFEDDSYFYINPMVIGIEYDKEHPRTEYRISIMDDEITDIYEKMAIHAKNFKYEKEDK